jgi:tetratricopeptide (TPR) repeat protein
MAWVLLAKDDIDGAEKFLPGSGMFALARGKFNENINLCRQNLEKSKGDKGKEAGAYHDLAIALERVGRYEEAYEAEGWYLKLSAEYRKSTELPYLPSQQKDDLFTKGRIQAEMKSFAEATMTAETLRAVVEKGINTKELRLYEFLLGEIEFGNKNYRKATDLYEKACGRLSVEGDAFFFDALARACFESGDLDRARQEYEKITLLIFGKVGNGDIYAKAFYMLGKIAEQQGDKTRAGQNYRKFLDLWKDADPGLPEPEDARKRLAGLKGS